MQGNVLLKLGVAVKFQTSRIVAEKDFDMRGVLLDQYILPKAGNHPIAVELHAFIPFATAFRNDFDQKERVDENVTIVVS